MEHKGKPPRLDRYFEDRPLYFVTFNTLHRKTLLACQNVHETFLAYCRRGSEMGVVEVGRYVIMPDHVHVFVRGNDELNLGLWIRGLKRAISASLAQHIELWQPGFFDHVLRSDESYEQKWEYVRQNPVRKNLVAQPEQWPYQGEIVVIDRL
jgi:REP element-mobilizing transposase RayT